jgi:hypothetical protein
MNAYPFRLRPGDVIEMDGKPCPIIRVTESAAVVAVAQAWREFTTLAGKRVQLQPAPKLVRISPNSDCPILNR